jgi:hypothetical protein
MSGNCPYDDFPPAAWWRPSVVQPSYEAVAPISAAPFRLAATDKIATAGSCFAQEIGRYLGGLFFQTETAPPRLSEDERRVRQFGLFSARYGNIYTARQFLQLLQRAYGTFEPRVDFWATDAGGFVDPFRPSVEPGGYASLEELRWDRTQHLAAVRALVEQADAFVFTLGLTEGWRDRRDGAAYPSCPGCGYGVHDPQIHEPHNQRSHEVIADLEAAYRLLKAHNPAIRLILTVSPVPLIATLSGQHVLAATTYSKSALRTAAEEFSAGKPDVCYFPSYEIVTGQYARGRYFSADLRTVTREGVAHVMRCFSAMLMDQAPAAAPAPSAPAPTATPDAARAETQRVICDEEELQRRYERAGGR